MSDLSLKEYIDELQTIWSALVRSDSIPVKADAIIVGGCRDLGLAERTSELYHAGVSDLIIVTGYQPQTMDMTEAKYLSDRCVELGVPRSVIVLEEMASNTGENITLAASKINEHKDYVESVILVHKPYMSLRFLATAQAQWPKPQPRFYATCQTISFEDYCKVNDLQDTAWKMLGDLKRMDGYVASGFQTVQNIPQSAKDAYAKIIKGGFITR
jgi:uncharacterized SAM-binding protein YcdF (DUF218 family)